MTKIPNFIYIFFFIICFNALYSENYFINENESLLEFQTQFRNASSIYDNDEKIKSYFVDTTNGKSRNWYFESTEYKFKLGVKYRLNKYIDLGIQIPFRYNKLIENFEKDSNNITITRYEGSALSIEQMSINNSLYLIESNFKLIIINRFAIPGNLSLSYQNQTQDISKYSPLTIQNGLFYYQNFGEFSIMNDLNHKFRFGEFSNLLDNKFILGLNSIKDISISGFFEYKKSYQNKDKLIDLKNYQKFENFLSMGFDFDMIYEKNILLNFGYNVKVFGQNTVMYGDFNLSFGIIF